MQHEPAAFLHLQYANHPFWPLVSKYTISTLTDFQKLLQNTKAFAQLKDIREKKEEEVFVKYRFLINKRNIGKCF